MPGNLITRLVERMSNTRIKTTKRKKERGNSNSNEKTDDQMDIEATLDPELETELTEIRDVKKLIAEKPNVFILNNLIMSIRLFSNYKREIERALEKLKTNEDRLNKKLLPEKSVLLPDVLQEFFTDRIRFTSKCKSDKDDLTIEPIRPIRIYMIYENVLVTEFDNSQHYADPKDLAIDYNFILKEANNKGYVKLETRKILIGNLNSDNTDFSSVADNESIYSDDYSIYSLTDQGNNHHVLLSKTLSTSTPDIYNENDDDENDDNYYRYEDKNTNLKNLQRLQGSVFPIKKSTTTSTTSSSSSECVVTKNQNNPSSDSDSSALNNRYSPRQNNFKMIKKYIDASVIPESCMKKVTYTYDGRIYNVKREPKTLSRQQKRIRDAKLAQNKDYTYVNGYRLAKHFNEAFRQQLGCLLDFDETTIKSSKRCDATIRLEKIDYLLSSDRSSYVKIEPYEVFPCFASPWPNWARGWLTRPRSDWPSYESLRHAEKFNCYLIPETSRSASLNAEPSHPLWKLDWSMNFPAAERYLETCLSSSQATVLTIGLMLHKTFIKALGSSFGLDTSHIRNMVFWMVERHPDWSESQMGQWMIDLLESLHRHTQQRTMHDYFMYERNLFANVNTDDLLHAQKQLKRIIENPVMYVLHAIEKIQHENHVDYYPRLNHAELLRLLTLNELLLQNPNLDPRAASSTSSETDESTGYAIYSQLKRDVDKKKDFWTELKENNQHYKQTRKRSAHNVINPKRIHDSVIDIQESCEPLTAIRLSKLVEFFAKHFLKMAYCCHDRRADEAKIAYLDQTRILAKLLSENSDYKDEAIDLLQKVKDLRDRAIENFTEEEDNDDNDYKPKTPRRNITKPPLGRQL